MNKFICQVLELQTKQSLILYSDGSDYHPVFKEFKAYLRKIYFYMWKEKKGNTKYTKTKKNQLGYVTGSSTGVLWKLGGSERQRDKQKDNAWKFCELKEEARHFFEKAADQLNWNEGLRIFGGKIWKV